MAKKELDVATTRPNVEIKDLDRALQFADVVELLIDGGREIIFIWIYHNSFDSWLIIICC